MNAKAQSLQIEISPRETGSCNPTRQPGQESGRGMEVGGLPGVEAHSGQVLTRREAR